MYKKVNLLFVLILISLYSYGQQSNEKIGIIVASKIDSKYIDEKRSIEIYLPPSYKVLETKRYPVMYVMDGQEYFLHPVAYQRMLRFKDKSPEFIVIGINTDRKKRRKLLYEDANKFMSFLTKELIPYVDKNYRTLKDRERLFFGWEMSGGLGLEIFTHYPNIFNAYFIASPTHLTDERVLALDKIKNTSNNTYLYFSRAPEEIYIEQSLNKTDSILNTLNSSNIIWKIDNLFNEDHYTTSLKTINNGLRAHFQDYNTLRFYSLKEFDEFGDLDHIKKYYQHRGNRYGISSDVHKTTRHFLLLNAMNEDNFERFEIYANEFQKHFQEPSLEIWPIRFGNYLAKNNKYKEALEIYEAGLKQFPESAAIYNTIGTFYRNKGDKSKATTYYKLAIDHARKNNDSKLKEYITHLEKL